MKQRGEITGLELLMLIVISLFIAYMLSNRTAHAEPKYIAQAPEGGALVLDTDQCVLPEVVNLPGRAIWMDEQEWFECCYSIERRIGAVVFYCTDRKIGQASISSFSEIDAQAEEDSDQSEDHD